jgi:hypothetical protein
MLYFIATLIQQTMVNTLNIMKKNMFKLYLFILACITTIGAESLVFPPYMHSYGIRKATPAHLFMFFGASTKFNNPQGLATARLDSWDDPDTKKDDDEVTVYGVNSGEHEIIYNTSMYKLSLFGKKGTGEGCFLFPKGVCADSKGNVYVADSGNNRIVHLFNPKANLEWVSAFNGNGESSRVLQGPMQVGLDENGFIYATDAVSRCIFVFLKDKKLYKTIPSENSRNIFIDAPRALAIADGKNRWSHFTNERLLYCADSSGRRIWKIDINNNSLKSNKLPEGFQASYGAVDYYHNYWITDTKKHCILKYDHNLELLDIFGNYGTKDNQFIEPRGIAIYKRYGQVFIAEKKGAQYYWVGTHYKSGLLKKLDNTRYNLTVKATEYSFVTLFSTNGKDTAYFVKKWMIAPDSTVLVINDSQDKITNNNIFLKIEPTYSSYTFSSWVYPIKVTDE